MNRNIICFWMGAMFCAGMPLYAQQGPVENPTKASKKDYRVEEERDKNGDRLKIKIVSPDNKVVKSFVPDDVTVAKNGKYLLHQSAYHAQEEKGYLENEKTLYSVRGEKKWVRTFRSYPASWDPEVGDPSWGSAGISDNGDRSYFNWRDEQGMYCIGVYSDTGKEVARISQPNALYNIEISPDGKLVGAETYLQSVNGTIKYLLFLDVASGRTKLVRGENSFGYASSSLHTQIKTKDGYESLKTGEITIYWHHNSGATGDMVIRFNELGEDVSGLFL